MSFPNKQDRERCWSAKDKYWMCLEANSEHLDACLDLRKIFESSCSNQWVKHFDRKRSYLLFKDKLETEGYESATINN